MAIAPLTTSLLQTTDAEFRAWVSAAKTALITTCGLVQTSDTGQIDVTTVSKPSVAGAMQGYLILKPNDGLADYYIKIEFGAGGMGTDQPGISLSLGWGTNGAGTLTGNFSTRKRLEIVARANAGVATPEWGFCKSGSAIIGFFDSNFKSGSGAFFMIDRFRDKDTGEALETGVTQWLGGNTNNQLAGTLANSAGNTGPLVFSSTESVPATGGILGEVPHASGTVGLYRDGIQVSATWSKGQYLNPACFYSWNIDGKVSPPIAGLILSNVDRVPNIEWDATVYGVDHHYRDIGVMADDVGRDRVSLIWE